MKKIITVFLIVFCIIGITACNSGNWDYLNAGEATTNSTPTAVRNREASEIGDSAGGWDGNYEAVEAEFYSAEIMTQAEELPVDTGRVIIRNANMSVEAENASELYRSLVAFTKVIGGYEFSSHRQNFDKYTAVDVVFKVPPGKLDDLLDFAGNNGKIISSRVDSRDVTDEFYDMTTRVESKRRSLESYYNMLEKANTLHEITSLQRMIDNIIEEIEAFEGRLRLLGSLAEMATVTIHIKQIYEVEEEEEEEEERREIDWGSLSADDVGYFIRTGFISVVNFFIMIFQWFVIALAVSSPVWIPTLIIISVSVKRYKKKRAERVSIIPEEKNN